MLPKGVNPHRTDNRTDYLLLPYDDPIRKAMRGVEAQLGALYFEQNARDQDSDGLFAGALAFVGAVAGLVILGPGGIFAGAALGAGVGLVADLEVKMRLMTANEWRLAKKVFGSSLPAYEDIVLTELGSPDGRAFTVPGSALAMVGGIIFPPVMAWLLAHPKAFTGKVLINLGKSMDRDFDTYVQGNPYSAPGQMLIHELTHAWQIKHGSTAGYMCKGLDAQARKTLGESVYAATPGQQWRDFGIEQQATLVDQWYQRAVNSGVFDSQFDPAYRYIEANIRTGNPSADSVYARYRNATGKDLASSVAGRFATPGLSSAKNLATSVLGRFPTP